MIIKTDWPKPGENTSFPQEVLLNHVSRLADCLKRYKDGEIDADTSLRRCRKILNEIKDPEFPFFAVKNFSELFAFILYQLPKISLRYRTSAHKSNGQCNVGRNMILTYDGTEKRKYKRIKKPFIVRFRMKKSKDHKMISSDWDMVAIKDLGAMGILFNYNKDLGIGSLLDLKIDISRYTPTIRCVGKVIRIRKYLNYSTFSTVTLFTEIDRRDNEMINQTTEDILK